MVHIVWELLSGARNNARFLSGASMRAQSGAALDAALRVAVT